MILRVQRTPTPTNYAVKYSFGRKRLSRRSAEITHKFAAKQFLAHRPEIKKTPYSLDYTPKNRH